MKISRKVLSDIFIDFEVGEKTDDRLLTLLFATDLKEKGDFFHKTIYIKSLDDKLFSYSSYAIYTKDSGYYYDGLETEREEIELEEADIEDYYCDRLIADRKQLKEIVGVLLVDDDTAELLEDYKFWSEN